MRLGKLKLNPILIDYIKSLVFQHFPLEEGKNKKQSGPNVLWRLMRKIVRQKDES